MSQVWMLFFLVGLCHGVSRATKCVSRGRFPNDEIAECRGYTTCLAGAGDVFYQYDLTCPPTFTYNHFDNQCTNATGYQCLPDFNCTEIGTFESSAAENCTSYIACIQGLSSIVTARLIECPMKTHFNPIKGVCVNETEYVCPRPTEPPNITEITVENLPEIAESVFVNSAIHLCIPSIILLFALSLVL